MSFNTKEILYRNRTNLLILAYAFLLGIAGIFDLQLSQLIANPQTSWIKVIEDYGELPGIITILTAIFIYHKTKKHSSNTRTVLYGFILLYSTFMLFSYIGNVLFKPFGSPIYPVIAFALLFTIISILLVKTLKVQFSVETFNFAKITLLMGVFGYALFVQPLKMFFGRIRFRDLNAFYSDFSAWYIPNGITGHESFPSGHSAMGFILISFFVLFRNKNTFLRYSVYLFILLWAFAVASSRVLIGAHFLSDVVVGSAGMVFCYIYFSNTERIRNL